MNYILGKNQSLNKFGIGDINIGVPNCFKKEEKMTEFKKVETDIKKFEKEGDAIQGVLVGVEKAANYENKIYKIKTSEGKITAVFGTTILEQLMDAASLGQEVQIILKGFKENKIKGRNPIKLFEVYIAA